MKYIGVFFMSLTFLTAADILRESLVSIPIKIINDKTAATWQESLTPAQQARLNLWDKKVESGLSATIEAADGTVDHVVFWPKAEEGFWQYAALAKAIPQKETYHLEGDLSPQEKDLACFAWEMGRYSFDRYKKPSDPKPYPSLIPPAGTNTQWVKAAVESTEWVRTLINTPANDLMPKDLAAEAATLTALNATITLTEGEDLAKGYPCVHTVGQSSHHKPYFIELTWSPTGIKARKNIAIVGKGVCFDSGGLDIKPSNYMLIMKKDMGGGAHALGLARMIMALNLPVNLHVLVPAVENAINGKAMRPMDVIRSRSGKTIEVENTDAEGRLILCDALTAAAERKPDYIFDFATLTGAARTAVGTEMGALFSNNEALQNQLHQLSKDCQDLVWPQPLHRPYFKYIKGKTADLSNLGSYSYAGHITAALFLDAFVPQDIPWVHLDIMAWNTSSTPGRPEGGEAMGMRAVFELIKKLVE